MEIEDFDLLQKKEREAMLKGACLVLNILIWKVPAIAGDNSGEWWAAELRDKNIPIEWDGEEFKPGVKK